MSNSNESIAALREKGELNREEIQRIIPHRDPMLMLDSVSSISEDCARGKKIVSDAEPHFKGHFPGNPVMPGVLMVEALAQLTGVMILSRKEYVGKTGYFAGIKSVRFREIVQPGCELDLEVRVLKCRKHFVQVDGTAKVGEKVACEAELMLYVGD